MPRMDDRELVALVDNEFETALGSPGGEISQDRARAWRYYLSEPLGNEVEGLSQVVTSDVSDVVDGIMPSLLRMFTTAENLVSFDPVGMEDVALAEQESDYVNYVFFKKNPAFMIMYTWFFDALSQKNGIVKAWYDKSVRVVTENYTGLTNEGLFALLEDDNVDPISRSETVDAATGAVLHDIEIKRTITEPRFRIENVPPEEYRISSDARNLDPSTARMVGQERDVTRSELISMGIDRAIVERLPSVGENIADEAQARYNKDDDRDGSTLDKSQEFVRVREAYIQVDYEGKGVSELRQVITSNGQILSNEPSDRQPFHVISSKPLPHKHFGTCPAEDVMDVQEVSTTLTRQVLDNLYHVNNPGYGVWEQGIGDYTLDDLLTRRVGGVVRFNRPVQESYQPLTVPFAAGSTFPMLAHFDKVKRDRTGVNSDSDGLNPDQLKNIQQSVMGQYMDISRMKLEAIARIFAETGIKSLFLHLHEMIVKHQKQAEIVRLRGQFVPIDPRIWRDRYDVTINIGLGIGTRDQNKLLLTQIKDMQSEIVNRGGMNLLVTPKNIYNTAAEFVRNANLKDPSMFFTDPGDQLAPPQSDEMMQLQQQQLQLQARQQEIDMKNQQLKEMQIQLNAMNDAAKLREQKEQREDDLMIEIEKLKNDLAEMELKYEEKPNTNQPIGGNQ